MPEKTKNCRYCREPISEAASVCAHCKKSQAGWRAWLESFTPLISVISICLSVVLVSLSWMQFLEAREQRRAASKAQEPSQVFLAQLWGISAIVGATGLRLWTYGWNCARL